jgi:mycothiol synthase
VLLPDGYRFRPATPDDVAALTLLVNADSAALSGKPAIDESFFRSRLGGVRPGRRDARVVVAGDGSDAGLLFVESVEPFAVANVMGVCGPAHHGRGLGGALVDEAERASRTLVGHDDALRVRQWAASDELRVEALLRARGYACVYRMARMAYDFGDGPVASVPLPTGLELRRFVAATDTAVVYACYREAFEDHWGDRVEELDEWEHEAISGSDAFDPALWQVAWDGSDVAGVLIGEADSAIDPDRAYVAALAVRRSWRRQGLGEALLRLAFASFEARGKAGVVLLVDEQSRTGATRLYERLGMRREPAFAAWERSL